MTWVMDGCKVCTKVVWSSGHPKGKREKGHNKTQSKQFLFQATLAEPDAQCLEAVVAKIAESSECRRVYTAWPVACIKRSKTSGLRASER